MSRGFRGISNESEGKGIGIVSFRGCWITIPWDETFGGGGPARGTITAGARTINQEYEARRKDVSNLQTNSYVS